MKRSVKIIVFLASLVIVIAAYLVVTKLVERADERAKAASKSEVEQIVLFDGSTLKSVTWEYEGEAHTFSVAMDTWTLTKDRNFPIDDTYISAMKKAVATVKSSRTLEEVTDFAQYGLENYACKIDLTNADGTVTLRVGDINPSSGKCYVLCNDDPTVHLVSGELRNAFEYTLLQIAKLEEIEKPSDAYGFGVTIGDRSFCAENIEAHSAVTTGEQSNYKWVRKLDGIDGLQGEDIPAEDAAVFEKAIDNFMNNLAWKECADIDLREKELGAYGLDRPACIVDIYYREEAKISSGKFNEDGSAILEDVTYDLSMTFTFGSRDDDGLYYATSSQTSRCYLVDPSVVQGILALESLLFSA